MSQAQLTCGPLSHDGTWFEWHVDEHGHLTVWTLESSRLVMGIRLDGAQAPYWYGEWGQPSYDAWRRAFQRALRLAVSGHPKLEGILHDQEERPPRHGRG